MRNFLRHIRDVSRVALGIADERAHFRILQRTLNPQTVRIHDDVLDWAIDAASVNDEASTDTGGPAPRPIAAEGLALREKTLQAFKDSKKDSPLRILVHIPPPDLSPAGFSAYSNLADSFEFLDIPCHRQVWGTPWDHLKHTRPNVFITSDHKVYLDDCDWPLIDSYREDAPLHIGLTAAPEGQADKPLKPRLDRAKRHGAGFFYSWHAPESLESSAYSPFRKTGLPLLSVEFGANILHYYPVADAKQDLDYVFLASSNRSKWERYRTWLAPILTGYGGFLDGPGWRHARRSLLADAPPGAGRYALSRARVGLNLHLAAQHCASLELNERTYILAACGVPQLVDAPALLPSRFSKNAMFIAKTPEEYASLFAHILRTPAEAEERATRAMREVFARHTTLHRASAFVDAITAHFFTEGE